MKKTYFSLIMLLTITFLFALSLLGYSETRKGLKDQPIKKAPTEVQRTKSLEIEVKSASPNNLRLEPGGKEVIVTLRGSNLDKVTSAKVVINNRSVRGVEIKLGSPSAKSIKVTLKASPNAMVGSNYKLRLIAGKETMDVSTLLVRLEVTAPKVVKKTPVKPVLTQVPPLPAKTLPSKPEITKPTEPRSKTAAKPLKKSVVKPSANGAKGKGRRGPQVAYAKLGGILTVNGSIGTVVVNEGETATVWWTIPPNIGATGVWLRVNNAPFGMDPNTICDQGMFSDLAQDSMYYAGVTGTRNLTLTANPPYMPGNSYYVMACAWGPVGPGVAAFRDSFTGTVDVQYQGAGPVGITLPPIPIEGVIISPPEEPTPPTEPTPVDLKLKNTNVHRNNKPDTYITFKIKNMGETTASDYQVRVRHLEPPQEVLLTIPVSGHTSDETRSFTVPTWPLIDGDHNIRFELWWSGITTMGSFQGTYGNIYPSYRKIPNVGLPDLDITNVHKHQNNSPNVVVHFKIKNEGDVSSPASGYSISFNVPGTIFNETVTISEVLGPGQKSGEYSTSDWGLDLPWNNNTLHIIVNQGEEFYEEKMSNNSATKSYNRN